MNDYRVLDITITREDFEALVELLDAKVHKFYNSSKITVYVDFDGALGKLDATISCTSILRTPVGDYYGKHNEYNFVQLYYDRINMRGTGARTHIDGKYPHMVLWQKILELVKPTEVTEERESVLRVVGAK